MSKHQYAMVMDLNKCLGCQTCTIACKKLWTDRDGTGYMYWNNVETRPGMGYPRQWDRIGGGWKNGQLQPSPLPTMDDYGHAWEFNYEQRLYEGKKKPVMPSPAPTSGVNWDEDVGGMNGGENYYFYLPRICNHCTYPACLASCPRGSIYKRPDDGIVLIDQSRCRGYQECVKACPYKKVFYNPMTGTSEKCIACFPKIEQGLQPQCFVNCIGKIRFAGWISTPEKAREDNPIDYLVHVRKVALPLFPQFGLEPNVYYVPPLHAPLTFLHQMFGPAADAALKTYRAAADDPDLAGLLGLFGSTDRVVPGWKREGDAILALDDDGREFARVPLKEPVFIRDALDAKYQIARVNCP